MPESVAYRSIALKEYPEPAQVDLILLTGCGNVGLLNLLNAVDSAMVDEMTQSKCGKPVANLLQRILTSFSNAQVVVTGYYPFFSENTRNDFIVRALAKKFFRTQPDGAPRMSHKEVFDRLKINSKQWYESSNHQLSEAVNNVNMVASGTRPRAIFAKIDFPPDYSFAAPRHIYGAWIARRLE